MYLSIEYTVRYRGTWELDATRLLPRENPPSQPSSRGGSTVGHSLMGMVIRPTTRTGRCPIMPIQGPDQLWDNALWCL